MEEDWDTLFDFDLTFPDNNNIIVPPPNHHAVVNNNNNNQSPPMSVDDIEHLLFNDDDLLPTDDAFLDNILLDSPLLEEDDDEEVEKSGEVVDLSDSSHNHNNQQPLLEEKDNDPLSKKRKRQLRNRDAALRSRERKKMHVKDLELKSRYYEGECKRLGSLLQWYMAENQALRYSLHTTSNASMTKQESAVLFLESLLLGSLLWLMGIMAALPSLVLLLVSNQAQSHLVTAVEGKPLPSLPLRKEETSNILSLGKRFKASRSRMRRPFLQFVTTILPVF